MRYESRRRLGVILDVLLLPFTILAFISRRIRNKWKKEKLVNSSTRSEETKIRAVEMPSDTNSTGNKARVILGTVVKGFLAIIFFPFAPLVLFFVGLKAKNKQTTLEGVLYSAILLFAVSLPTTTLTSFLGVGAIAAGVIRLFQFRELWLTGSHQDSAVSQISTPAPLPVEGTPVKEPSLIEAAQGLSLDLSRLMSEARQNKHRLPAEAYVTVLECQQTLDSVVDMEKVNPSEDAQFRYELDAMINDYLPSVLKNYLSIPADLKEETVPGGKTPNEELTEQLGLLQAQANALYSSRHWNTSAKLADTGHFLREKFGHHKQDQFDFGI